MGEQNLLNQAKARFFDAVIHNSLEELVTTAYELFGFPVLINDELGNSLALMPKKHIGNPDYDYLVDHHTSSEEHFMKFYRDYISDYRAKQYPILIHDGAKKSSRQLFSIIWANRLIVGYSAVLIEKGVPDAQMEEAVRIMNHAARSILIYTKDKERANESRSNHILNYLLTVPDYHSEDYINNAKTLGSRYKGPYMILRVKCDKQGLEDIYTPTLFTSIRRKFPNVIYTDLDKGFYFLLGEYLEEKIEELIKELELALSPYPIHISSSIPFHDITAIRGYYQQARQTMIIGEKISSHLFYYRTIYYLPLQIYSYFVEENDVDPYINPVLKKIIAYDNEKGTEYYVTLWMYLYCFMNVKEASKMLNVHINTLHYRILRMEELFGLDFKNYYMLNACISNFGLIYSSQALHWKDMEHKYLMGHNEKDIYQFWFSPKEEE